MTATLFPDVRGDAHFSACGRYRYWLSRQWSDGQRFVNFLMCNPSKATAEVSDPTVTRCVERAKRLGFDGLHVTNLFALRSTDPAELYAGGDPVGPGNNTAIVTCAHADEVVVCAWGVHGLHLGRGEAVLRLLRERGHGDKLRCLGTTKDGHPFHPLYQPYTRELVAFGC